MATRRVIAWTPEMEALLGTMPDAAVAHRIGEEESRARYRRLKLGIPAYRTTHAGSVEIPCANCGRVVRRRRRDLRRSMRLYCSKTCADAGQKRRDTDTLRYGPGWKNTRALIRRRDKTCRACGMTPEQNGGPLHVHHLKPFRFAGTNLPDNLVALCESCHHVAEAMTTQALDALPIRVELDGSYLTVTLADAELWRGSVVAAPFPTETGSIPSSR